jgi:hypothetical protein
MGYYMNILARLGITKVLIRLIAKELERVDFDDAYSMTRSEQKEVFISVVKKHSKVNAESKLSERCDDKWIGTGLRRISYKL